MQQPIHVGICGIQGYVGQELARLVISHPKLKLVGVLSRQAESELYQEMPELAQHHVPLMSIDEIVQNSSLFHVLLLATPAEVSMEFVAKLKDKNIKIVDLSGAFRLPKNEFLQWYGFEHKIPELLDNIQYGLSPWMKKFNENTVLANPGCYATCALMSLIPLLKNNVIQTNDIIIDAKSGISGAGKQFNQDNMFCEIANNFFPYKIGKHQHTPEINHGLKKFSGKTCHVILTTHVLPVVRGMSMSIYANAQQHLTSDDEISMAIEEAFMTAYKNYPFVKFAKINSGQITKDKFILSLKNVVGTPGVNIGYYVNSGKVFIFACIDNLLKGAASQAIENINAMFQMPLTTGLLNAEVVV